MILFLEDWNKYPSAIADVDTTNKSFLDYAEKLRLKGVKNYLFPLSLLNPDLVGVDPYDPKLTLEQVVAIQIECRYNVWYYLREVHRVAPQASTEGSPLIANRANMGYVWCCMNHLSVGLTQPRQTGKSVIADALASWVMNSAARNSKIYLITKDHQLRDSNVARISTARQCLPSYIAAINRHDVDNTSSISNSRYKNTVLTAVGQNSVEAGNKAGRGLTAPIFKFDEPPFTKYIRIMLPAALPAYSAASKEAARSNMPHYISYTTTAGELNNPDGKFMYNILTKGMWFSEVLFDCTNAGKMEQMIRKQAAGDALLVYVNFLHYQLGYTDEWLFENLATTHSSGQAADRDYFNIWTNGSAEHPLDKHLLDLIVRSRRETVFEEVDENMYHLKWYVSKEEIERRRQQDIKISCSIDMSEGVGRDSMAVDIRCTRSLDLLATMNINETNIFIFQEWVFNLMLKHPNLILIPENKGPGIGLIDSLFVKLPPEGIDPIKRIYNRMVDEDYSSHPVLGQYRKPMNLRTPQFWQAAKTLMGFRTAGGGAHSRSKLYVETLKLAAAYTADKMYDAELGNQILGLVTKNGRIDHAAGSHDDSVVAWLLNCWFLIHTKNLDWYGIKGALCEVNDVTRSNEATVDKSEYEQYVDNIERKLHKELLGYIEVLKDTDDLLAIDRMQRRIRVIEQRIDVSSVLPKSVNDMVNEAMDNRRRRLAEKRHARLNTRRQQLNYY